MRALVFVTLVVAAFAADILAIDNADSLGLVEGGMKYVSLQVDAEHEWMMFPDGHIESFNGNDGRRHVGSEGQEQRWYIRCGHRCVGGETYEIEFKKICTGCYLDHEEPVSKKIVINVSSAGAYGSNNGAIP